MNKSILLLLSMFVSFSVTAEPGTYKLKITRDGVTQTKLAYNYWSGEYPLPVADVTAKTTVKAYRSVRKLNRKVACTIDKGIYHPWSNNQGSVINFYTLTNAVDAIVTDDFQDEIMWEDFGHSEMFAPQKGDIINEIYYGSEGICGGKLFELNSDPTPVSFYCDSFFEGNIDYLSKDTDLDWGEQWLYLRCDEGYNAFIQDYQLMTSPKVKEGQIWGFGSVGPATTYQQRQTKKKTVYKK